MTDDGWQAMLFGSTTETANADELPPGKLSICALNVQSPSPARAQRIADWLLSCGANVLALTEMQASQGGRHIMSCLHAEGFTTTCTPGWQDQRYCAVVATRGLKTAAVEPSPFDPRVVAVDIGNGDATMRLVAVYAPSNGMSAESSHHRNTFQQRLLAHLREIDHPGLLVTGDLNVVEPDHQPRLPAYADHDYAFYTGLLDLGLRDTYRALNPNGTDHSWFSSRFGNQRLDHTMTAAGIGEIGCCTYDHSTRDGLSDHAAMMTTLDLPRRDGAAGG